MFWQPGPSEEVLSNKLLNTYNHTHIYTLTHTEHNFTLKSITKTRCVVHNLVLGRMGLQVRGGSLDTPADWHVWGRRGRDRGFVGKGRFRSQHVWQLKADHPSEKLLVVLIKTLPALQHPVSQNPRLWRRGCRWFSAAWGHPLLPSPGKSAQCFAAYRNKSLSPSLCPES